MSGFYGMDTAQVEGFGGAVENGATTLEERFAALSGLIASVLGTHWVGPDADAFGDRYRSEVEPRLERALSDLRDRRAQLDEHREQQDDASADAAGGGFLDGLGDWFGDVFDAAGGFLGEVWGNFVDNLIPNLGNVGGLGATTLGDVLGPLAKSGSKLLAGGVPLLGDVYTGVLAGIERWNQDSEYGLGERIFRTGLDAGANFLGSFAGGTVGSSIGLALGTAIGGGGGAAAGSPTGPGAIVTAIGGGSLLGGIGFIAGDAVGGYIGGAAGDAVIDAILD